MGESEAAGQIVIGPQPGPQTAFLSSAADIAIYGGAAGGGKTWGLLIEPLRHSGNKHFGAVFFRRTLVQVRNEGGLWDESGKLYPLLGATSKVAPDMCWSFPSGASISFGHLEHDKTVYDWQGAQIPLLCFDELTHFSEKQFWYLVSRNRSMCGVRPYIRATCNPDADSWVAKFIAWWIDEKTGYPIPERSGVLRWFARINDVLLWADSAEELKAEHPECEPKSLTFVPAKLTDNAALMAADPAYRANLMALPQVERERLLNGNWKIRPAAGLYFQRRWCPFIEAHQLPPLARIVRGWDLASTPKTPDNDPDWTAGTKIAITEDGRYIVLDHRRMRGTPAQVEEELKRTATIDGIYTEISVPQDPGQAGKSQVASIYKLLAGYTVHATTEGRPVNSTTPSAVSAKVARFGPFSAQAQAGNVMVLRGDWNEEWATQLEAFPEASHDDDADATSRAFNAFLAPEGQLLFA